MVKFFYFALLFLANLCLHSTVLSAQTIENRPNILWLVCEDISPALSMYGDSTAKTPNLDKLAQESIIFDHAFTSTGVCAPSRSAIITGMYPTSIGTMHMRTGNDVFGWGKQQYNDVVFDHFGQQVFDLGNNPLRQYSAVIPAGIKCFTEYLRANGYYCTNNAKTDYQFAAPQSAWDENDQKAHWRNRPEGLPFFSVFNFNDTHESKIWEYRDKQLTVDPETVPLPPYFPDNDIVRTDIARMYSNIEIMDNKVGKIIRQLQEDGLYENTIIFFFSDHGGPLPRQKREVTDSGLRTPFLVRIPGSNQTGHFRQMVSFVDLAPTVLSLAGIKPPENIDGQAFMGIYAEKERKVIYGTSDRFDEFTDRIRVVRDTQFLYVKNYYVDQPKFKNVSYRLNIPMMPEILRLRDENQLNDDQMYWFLPKTSEELYDTKTDPHQLNNLAQNPAYTGILREMRHLCKVQFENKLDYGSIHEAQLVEKMWPGGVQPQVEKVIAKFKKNRLSLSCPTKSSSISYIEFPAGGTEELSRDSRWKLYTKPFIPAKGVDVYVKADRIGYKDSEILKVIVR